ncbi:MAG: cytochrome c-type biogenesis protein CcmH, partial [Alphaproteobacteria bacterium]|nr:cytochrome c-type biogenesis protein CcmH [Alphaproteobacteria bacterium]
MLMLVLRRLCLGLCLMGLVAPAWSVAVDPPLDDPVLEARARAIHKQLRCLVCQNQSIEDSNATLARDLRMLVRERITAGDSDEATIRFIVARYGDWVLLRPPMKVGTVLL